MSRQLELQEKLRRSEVLSEEDIYKDFMAYASEVRDELQLYIYMEENHIGIEQVDYWLARFKAMRSRCQIASLVELLARVKSLPALQEDRRKIEQYEQRLFVDLKNIIYSSFSGKRKTSSFTQLRDALHPQKRKIGNIEVFVDERYRHNYYIQDFAKYIEEEMSSYCAIEREDYLRRQAIKPPSFLAKKEDHLMQLAQQLLNKNNRKSLHDRNSHGNIRFSNQLNIKANQHLKQEDYQTPKTEESQLQDSKEPIKMCANNTEKQKTRTKGKSNRDLSRDSVQILRQIHERHSDIADSPKFRLEGEQQESLNKLPDIGAIEEKARHASREESEFTFSFGKPAVANSGYKLKEKKRLDPEAEPIDNAFILYSFSQDNFISQKNNYLLKNEDFELELLIYDIQREKYDRLQSQTFSSEIDSNQENYDSKSRFPSQKSPNKIRKPFEVLLQSSNDSHKDVPSINLQQLVAFDDEERNPELLWTEQKSQKDQTEKGHKISPFSIFRSEQKRLSNISEEPSYFSQSKQKHSSRFG